jgi:hypothetical protein
MAVKRHQQAIGRPPMSYVNKIGPDLARLLEHQDGVVTVEQLAVHGFDSSALYRRLRAGRWLRLLPTVVLTSGGPPTRRQLLVAAALWGGADAVIDGPDALAWYGLKLPRLDLQRVHIVVPWGGTARSRGHVVVRRTRAAIRVGAIGRLRYVDEATALIVAARMSASVETAIDVLSRGLQTGLVTTDQLLEARACIGDKWCRGVDRALVTVGVGLRSPAEIQNHDLVLTSRILTEPRWNQWLDLGDGGAQVCADALWEDAGMVEEVLGKRWHGWGQQFESTEARRARLVAAGLVAQGATPIQLRQSPAAVLERLERTYLLNRGRGMPSGVRLIDPPGWAIAC